jgi:hypothetical protein
MNTRVSSPARTEMLDKLWDYGHVEWALLDFVHREAALLVGPVDELLIALARPLHPRHFLVAAIAPPGTDGCRHRSTPCRPSAGSPTSTRSPISATPCAPR